MQLKAEELEYIDSIEFRTTSNTEHLSSIATSASQSNDCLGTRSKASSFVECTINKKFSNCTRLKARAILRTFKITRTY